jgi:hypothetical protein
MPECAVAPKVKPGEPFSQEMDECFYYDLFRHVDAPRLLFGNVIRAREHGAASRYRIAFDYGNFTFRIPDLIVGQLNSSEMRSWLTEFLYNPQPIPEAQRLIAAKVEGVFAPNCSQTYGTRKRVGGCNPVKT